MKRPAIPDQEEPQSMSAMTDVVFLLLIFFIVTMSGYIEMTLLETNLPGEAGSAGAVDLEKNVKLELLADGSCAVNGTVQTPASLERLFRRYARLMPDAEFMIGCDPESRHHQLVSVLSGLATYRLKNVRLLK